MSFLASLHNVYDIFEINKYLIRQFYKVRK